MVMGFRERLMSRSWVGTIAWAYVASVGVIACSSSSDSTATDSNDAGDSQNPGNDAGNAKSADGGPSSPNKDASASDGGPTLSVDGGASDAFSLCTGYTEVTSGNYTVSNSLINGTATAITNGTEYAIAATASGGNEAMGVYKVAGATDICVTADMAWMGSGTINQMIAFVDSDGKYSSGDSEYTLCALDADAGVRTYGSCLGFDALTAIPSDGQPLHVAARLEQDPFKTGSSNVQGQVEISNTAGTQAMDGNLGSAGGLGGDPTSLELHLGVRYGSFADEAYPAATVDITNVHVFKR
jgi:hypothetical protein